MFCSIQTANFEKKHVLDFKDKSFSENVLQISYFITSTIRRIFFSVEGMGFGGNSCPKSYVCMESDALPTPSFGFIGFDNGLQSIFTTYQMLMAEGLADVMYIMMDSTNFFAFLFFIVLYFAGPFLIQNFFVVIITKLVARSISLFEKGLKHNSLMRVFQVNGDLLGKATVSLGKAYDKGVDLFVPHMFIKFQRWVYKYYHLNSLAVVFVFLSISIFSCQTSNLIKIELFLNSQTHVLILILEHHHVVFVLLSSRRSIAWYSEIFELHFLGHVHIGRHFANGWTWIEAVLLRFFPSFGSIFCCSRFLPTFCQFASTRRFCNQSFQDV